METSPWVVSPERHLIPNRGDGKPPLEWFVFVINELCPKSLIWENDYRGRRMLYRAAIKHGYSDFSIRNFLQKNGFPLLNNDRELTFSNREVEDNCFAILIDGCNG